MIALAIKDAPVTHTMVGMNTYQTDSRGKRIAWARKQAGITGAQLARAVGVRNVTISYIENDRRELSLPLLLKIAQVTGVTVGFLLLETEYPYRQEVPPEPKSGPVYISEEADAIAQLIDDLPEVKRQEALSVLRTIAAYALHGQQPPPAEVEQKIPDVRRKKRVASSRDDSFAGRLIHSDKVRQSQANERAGA